MTFAIVGHLVLAWGSLFMVLGAFEVQGGEGTQGFPGSHCLLAFQCLVFGIWRLLLYTLSKYRAS